MAETTSLETIGSFTVIGVNHRDCPDAIREQLFVADEELSGILAGLRDLGFVEAVPLSTCDRVEIGGVAPADPEIIARVATLLGQPVGLPGEMLLPYFKRLSGLAAVRHWFRVAASLESQVVGEPQVLGQVRASHKMARELGMCGPVTEAVLRHAYQAAKRVRSETEIGARPVSIAACAVQVARDIHGELERCRGVLIGAGEFGLLVARQLRQAGLADLTVTDRNPRRAEATARELGVHFADIDELGPLMATSEITIGALGDGRRVLNEEMVRAVLKQRRNRPVFLVDLAVPGDIDPAVERIDAAFLYDLEDLEGVASESRVSRGVAAREADAIIDAELEGFRQQRAERGAVPLIRALRDHFESVRAEVLAQHGTGDVDALSRALINRLLHDPSEGLRKLSADGSLDPVTERGLRQLFGLEATSDSSEQEEGNES